MNKAVINPKTGRKVSVNSSLGKKILNDYSQKGGNPIFVEVVSPTISRRMLNRSPNDMNPVRHSPDVIIDQKISSTCSRCHNLSMLKEQIDTQLKSSCSDCKKLIEIKSDRDRITKLARDTLQKKLKTIREKISAKDDALSPQSPESPKKPARKSSLKVGLKLKDMAKSLSSKKLPKKSPVKATKKSKTPNKPPVKSAQKSAQKSKTPKKSPVKSAQKSKKPKKTPKSNREKSPKKSPKNSSKKP